MVRGVGVPAQFLHVPDEGAEVLHPAREALEVVAGFVLPVHSIGVEAFDGAVVPPAHQKMLGLDAHVEDVAFLAEVRQRVLQGRAGAIGPRLAVDMDIAGEAGHAPLPGDQRVRGKIGHGQHVVVVGALAHPPYGRPREAGPAFNQVVEVLGRNALAPGGAVDVHVLGEDVVHLVRLQAPADLGLRHPLSSQD